MDRRLAAEDLVHSVSSFAARNIGAHAGGQVAQPRYTFLLFLVSLNILLAIIVESFLRVKQAAGSVAPPGSHLPVWLLSS